MIRCTKCGTLNRDNNRFCNECGAPLHKTRIRCPQCGTLNPVGNVFCDHCHTRLVPADEGASIVNDEKSSDDMLPRLQGISLPTRSAPTGESDAVGKDRELPDWLMGFLEPENAQSGVGRVDSSAPILPDWLSATGEADTSEGQVLAPADLPDWLAALKEASAAPAASQPEVAPAEELPDWLSKAKELGESDAAPEPEVAPAAGLPDWLSKAKELGESDAAPEPEVASVAELPDWLAELQQAGAAATVLESEGIPAEGLPDWLSDAMEASESDTALQPEAVPAQGLPDWLSDAMEPGGFDTASEPEAVPVEGRPDWLSEVKGEHLGVPTPVDSSVGLGPDATVQEVDELPDWLPGIAGAPIVPADALSGAAPEVPAGTPVPAVQNAFSTGREEIGTKASGTDWSGEDAFAAQGVSEPIGENADVQDRMSEDVPEWLRALGPLAAAAAMEAVPEGLEQAEVPMWLERYRPMGTEPLEFDRAAGQTEGVEDLQDELARAEIPDWVQSYRPTADSAQEGASMLEAVLLGSAESQGPLSGLAGLLPALSAVDASEQLGTESTPVLPDSVVKGAQLWQRLLERDPGGEPVRPRTRQRATWPSTVLRVLIAVMLVLVSVLRFSETPLAQPPEQPGIPALVSTIESLPVDAEVLVAFEYTPAEVDEMQFIVEAMLEHLLSRGVRVVGVSTLPEGPGLIQERFDWAAIRPGVPADELVNLGFVAGGASGIAAILANFGSGIDPELLVVITSRPETLRAWIEQTAVLNETRAVAGKSLLPLVVGVSAAATPEMRPYLDVSADSGWLSGFSGVAAYWTARGLPPREDISRRLDALLLTQWLVASLLLAGALYNALAGKKRTV